MSALREAALEALEALELHGKQYPHMVKGYCLDAITALRSALAQQEQEPVEIKPPNPEGATQCIVRWFAETPAGWVGAWDREALERFTAHPPRRELAHAELHALNGELLEALKDAARCVQNNYLPDFCGHDWDEVIAKAEGEKT
jgi:hypothetical protein